MKINLTKKQYWDMMRSVYIGYWVANAICEDDKEKDNGIESVRNYIFSFAKEFGLEKYAEYDNELNKYYATWDMDDEPSVRDLIERYDEHTFWDEMSHRLGKRDFFRRYTEKEIENMDEEDYFENIMRYEIEWEEEFEKNGIECLRLDNNKKSKPNPKNDQRKK